MTANDLRSALTDPAAYPGRPERIEVRETHISLVFLAGDRAYKLKKALTLPFLDYGSLERRRVMCQEEVRLNRRLAPRVYLGVRSVVARDTGVALGDADAPGAIDYLVEMRRVPEATTLAGLVACDVATPAQLREVGVRLARFHADVPATAVPGGVVARLRASFEETVATLRSLAADLDRELAAAERFFDAYVTTHAAELAERESGGRVRDGHGDLRAEHVLLEHGIEVLDCVEFDPALRQIDVGDDLSFLVMDLHRLGRPDAADLVIAAYREAGGDPGDDSFLAFHAAQRAWVRAKVALVRAGEIAGPGAAEQTARAHSLARLAERLRWRARRPLLLVICGVAAVGKSYLASALAEAADLPVLSSDETRKTLAGLSPCARGGQGLYDEQMNARTYAELGRRARAALESDCGAIVDGTFRRSSDRRAFAEALVAAGVSPVFVECTADVRVIRERAERRERQPGRISDADAAIALHQLSEWEPLAEVPSPDRTTVRTDIPTAAAVDSLEAFLDRRLAGGGASDG